MPSFAIIGVWFTALSVLSQCSAFVLTDVIPIARRVQFNDERTAWGNLPSSQCPHFGLNRKFDLELVNDPFGHNDYKIQFSFNHEQFMTPWVTVAHAGEKQWLDFVEIIFVYSGGSIVSVEHRPVYRTMTQEQIEGELKLGRDSIQIRYTWAEFVEEDLSLGMDTVFLSTFLVGVAVMLLSFTSASSLNLPPSAKGRAAHAAIYDVQSPDSPRAARDLLRFNQGSAAGTTHMD